MAGVFDFKKGAFDSSEAGRLRQAYEIALHGLRVSHEVDPAVMQRLSRSVIKVARTEADCLKNDGTIDPPRLAQRAILRMLQVSAPSGRVRAPVDLRVERGRRVAASAGDEPVLAADSSPSKIMQRLFDRSTFAKV